MISELNFRWFSELQDLHLISSTPREAMVEYEPWLVISECALLPAGLSHTVLLKSGYDLARTGAGARKG